MTAQSNGKQWGWVTRTAAVFLVLALYGLSTGPVTFLVAKLNGEDHTVTGPGRILLVAYKPFYGALRYAPAPIVRAWETYDTFFWQMATKP